MAKKAEKLTLKDLIASQKEAKIGMSASVLAQLKAATGATPETQTVSPQNMAPAEKDKIVEELQKINKAININLVDQLGNIAKAIQKSTNAITSLITGRNPESGKKVEKAKSDAGLTETQLEDQEFKEKELKLFTKIEENTRKDKKPEKEGLFDGLGKWGMLLATAIGSFIGVLRAKIRAIKYFIDLLVPDGLILKAKKVFTGIAKFFDEITAGTRNKFARMFGNIIKFVEEFVAKIKSVFSEDNRLVKIFRGLMKWIGKLTAPFVEAFTVIKDLVSGPVSKVSGIFGNITKWFGAFAKSIGAVAKIVGKLFLPITIIMAVWDTVKGAIEGFKKEGIIGGIKGALTGLFGSLVGGLADLIKDGISWILGAFGFKEAEKFLDSFSFTDIFKQFIDILFKPIDFIKNLFNNMIDWFKKLEIPAIGFSAFGKSFKMGPWKPFAGDNSKTDTQAPAQAATPSVATPTAASVVYSKSSENAAVPMNNPAQSNTIVSAPTTITKSTSNNIVRPSLRDEDRSITSYYRSRYST